MKTTIEVNIVDTDMVLTNSKGDTFTIPDTRRNIELIDFISRGINGVLNSDTRCVLTWNSGITKGQIDSWRK